MTRSKHLIALALSLAFTASAQMAPTTVKVRPHRIVTNNVNLTLAWSNSPSPDVLGTILYWGLNAGSNTAYTFSVTNGLTNQATVSLSYTNRPTREGWQFAITAFDATGESAKSEPTTWHIPWLDYSEMIISGTPPFYWSADTQNWMPIQTIQSSFVMMNNGGARYFRSGSKTTVTPTTR